MTIPFKNEDLEVYVLNTELQLVETIDTYISFFWVDKYNEYGEFVLELPLTFIQTNLIKGYFVTVKYSDRIMKIQDIKYEPDTELGSKIVVSGYSGEYLLKDRIIEEPLHMSGVLQDNIISLIDENIADGSNPARNMPNFTFDYDPLPPVSSSLYENLFEEQSLYDIIKTSLDSKDFGFSVFFDSDTRQLVFKITNGTDRSYEQTVMPFVVFSTEYENVSSWKYYLSGTDEKTVVLVLTPDEIALLKSVLVWEGSEPSGFDRKEMVIQNSIDRASVTPPLSDSEVADIITARGLSALFETRSVGAIDAEVSILTGPFVYGVDFFLGDLVQFYITPEISRPARISEVVLTSNEEKTTSYVQLMFNN